MNTRPFPLASVLSVMTGRPVHPATAEDALRLMEWITGTPLLMHDHILFRRVPAASRASADALRADHPDLARAGVPDFADRSAVTAWADEMAGRFGPVRNVARFVTVPEQRSAAA